MTPKQSPSPHPSITSRGVDLISLFSKARSGGPGTRPKTRTGVNVNIVNTMIGEA